MDENMRTGQQETPAGSDDQSYVNIKDLIRERAFMCARPPETLFEEIEKQFEDYINMEVEVNLVDYFYSSLARSYDRVNSDDSEEYPNEIREVLDSIHQEFIDLMQRLFADRLTIGISDLEAEVIKRDDLEFIIRRLYEFFILGARLNFKTVISKHISSKLENFTGDESAYFIEIQKLIEDYSPLISTMTPSQFLLYREDKEIIDLFENSQITGNFLRKYSPKLYQNEEFTVELINHITMIDRFRKAMEDSKLEEV